MIIFRDSSLRKQIFGICGPAMLEMIMYMVVGLVDVAFVGRLGAAPLAAVGLGAEIFFATVIFMGALSTGSVILVAQARGAGRDEDVDRIAGYTLFIGLLLGLLAGWFFLRFAPQIVGLFHVEKAVCNQALDYLNITFLITPIALASYMSKGIFRGLGRTSIPMSIALMENLVNVLGDYVLVFGKWGFPHMGVAGAALATSVAHVLGFLVVLYLLFSGRGGLRIRFHLMLPFNRELFGGIFLLGLPSLAEQCFNTLASLFSIFLLVYTGTLVFASHEVAITVESVSFMPGMGVAIAATAMVGRALGAGDRHALRRAARGAMEMGLLLMGTLGVIFALFPQQVAAIFTNDPRIITITGMLIRIAALEQLTIAFSMISAGIFKGVGDTRTPFIISTSFTWLFRLPLMYLIIRVWQNGIIWVWMLFILDWLLRAVVFGLILWRGRWKEAQARLEKIQ